MVDEDLGQIWKIEEIDNQILVGAHQGVFVINNDEIDPILIEGGGWIFRKHPKIDDILYVGFYSGIGVFKRINGKWEFYQMYYHSIPDVDMNFRNRLSWKIWIITANQFQKSDSIF